MNAFIEATKWPMGFEPDDTTSLLQCTIVNERTSVEASVGQHVHQTGQFVVALSGLVGLALGRNRIAFPPSSAAWVPPGCRHEGFLGEGAVSLYCLINPEWAAMLPAEPYRLLLSPMVIEMLKHFSTLPRRYPMHSHEARLAGGTRCRAETPHQFCAVSRPSRTQAHCGIHYSSSSARQACRFMGSRNRHERTYTRKTCPQRNRTFLWRMAAEDRYAHRYSKTSGRGTR